MHSRIFPAPSPVVEMLPLGPVGRCSVGARRPTTKTGERAPDDERGWMEARSMKSRRVPLGAGVPALARVDESSRPPGRVARSLPICTVGIGVPSDDLEGLSG